MLLEGRQRGREGFEIFDRQCTFYKISNRKKCTSTFRRPPLVQFPSRFNPARLASFFSFFLLPFHTDVSQFELACTWKSLHGQFILDGRRESPVGRVYARVHAEQDEERKCNQFHGQHTANLSVSLSLSLSARWLQQVEEGKRPLLHHPSSPSSSVERTYPIQTAAHSCASRAR